MRRVFIPIVIVFCLLLCESSYAQAINDGFHSTRQIDSKYFTIFIEDGVDSEKLAMKVYVPPSIRAIIKKEPSSDYGYSLPEQFDLLFLAISEIMDIRLRKFKCKVKICKDISSLSNVAKKLFGRHIKTGGFYVVEIDTLYVDANGINIHILGHELSHAVQSHYFVVPLPTRIQEVLAGFVEFQLRKYTQSLPNQEK